MESPARTLSCSLAEHVEAVCKHYLSNGRRCGNYWVVGDVNNNAGRSLYVRLKGPLFGKGARGRWTDSATSEHGDLLDLIRAREGLVSFRDTFDEARRFLQSPRERTTENRDGNSSECNTISLARKIWAASQPIIGTKAEAYLRARKISADLNDAPLRYLPALIYRERRNSPPRKLPALVAAVTDHKGEIRGVHRTFLDPEKNDKANVVSPRRSLGAILGNGVRFSAIDQFAIIGEGIETVLSLKSVAPHLPMVAALSAAHLAAWEIPAGVRRLIIAVDNDRAGRNGARKLSERAEAEGVRVGMIVSQGKDFNDELRHTGLECLRFRLAKSLPMSEFEESRRS
ncbi:DUF7146 domain-containing protein [Methylocystis sp.]|uniref:DUF7146 domain-containing protein n=1 Tax=Methylocystis sp. TaxID=1911079 RepID=UPI003D0FF04E